MMIIPKVILLRILPFPFLKVSTPKINEKVFKTRMHLKLAEKIFLKCMPLEIKFVLLMAFAFTKSQKAHAQFPADHTSRENYLMNRFRFMSTFELFYNKGQNVISRDH